MILSARDRFRVITSDKILKGNYAPQFTIDLSSNLVEYILSAIRIYGIDVSPAPTGEVLPDMKDLPFYEVVYEKKDEGAYLVTGNLKHFPVKPFIVTARQMLNIISGKEAPGDLTGLD